MVHGAKLAWASHMGYVGAFAIGTNLLPESKKRTVKAPAGSPELRVHGVSSVWVIGGASGGGQAEQAPKQQAHAKSVGWDPELRVRGTASTTALQHTAWHITTD